MITQAASYENTEALLSKSRASCVMATREQAMAWLATMVDFALDFETTSLDPRVGRVRLTSICNDDHHFIIDHDMCGPLSDYIPLLRGKPTGAKVVWVYNSKFETTWLDHNDPLSFDSSKWIRTRDVDFLAKAHIGGHPSSLAKMVKRDLKAIIDKQEQNSNWGDPYLSPSQLDYAGFDSYLTWQLKQHWFAKLEHSQIDAAEFVFDYAVRGTTECERTGIELDAEYHSGTVSLWEMKHATFLRYIRKLTPEGVIKNLNSDMQIGKYLATILPQEVIDHWPRTEKKKQMQFEGKYLRSISRNFGYPFSRWLAALAGYKYYSKYLSTYGDTLLNKQALSGVVTARYNIAQAATGRYSSANVNKQNIPRKQVVRKAFYVSDPTLELLCLADYKGVEIRALGEISGDKQLLYDATYSDVHAASCAAIYDYALDWVLQVLNSMGKGELGAKYMLLKEQRSKAKGFTFQLIYGAAAAALSDVLKCSVSEAESALDAWVARYPKAYNYRNTIYSHMQVTHGFIPIADGRSVYVHRDDRTMPIAANYGVQGIAASVMYRAVGRTHRLFVERDIPAKLAATVHDELISRSETSAAEEAMAAQIEGMTQAWLDVFPGSDTANLIDWKIGTTWADKP